MLRLATDKFHLEYQEAIDVNSGRPQIQLTGRNGTTWQRILANPAAAAAMLLLPPNSDSMFIAYDFDLYALNGHDGGILWQRHFDEPIWACHLLPGTDLLVHLELSLVRLDVNGNEQWFYSHSDIITAVQIQANQLYLEDFDEHQFKLNLTTGLAISAALDKS
jgi:hypothetical protein